MITYAELQGPHYHYPGQAGSYARPSLSGLGACRAELEGHYPGQYPSHVHLSGLGFGFGAPWTPGKLLLAGVGLFAGAKFLGLIK